MTIELYFELMVAPSLSDLKQRREAERGLADGEDGRVPASQDRTYTAAFQRGSWNRRVAAREVAMVMRVQCRCPNCLEVYEFHPALSLCACTPLGCPVEHGYATLYGHQPDDDEPSYYSARELRKLVQEGVEVLTLHGERLNERLSLQ